MSYVWIFFGVILVTVVANLSHINARFIHGDNFSALAVFSPNQFVFPLFVFPFIAFFVFQSFYFFYFKLMPKLASVDGVFGGLYVVPRNPATPILLTILVACIFSWALFYKGQWTFDKLKPEYASMALSAVSDIDSQLRAIPKDEVSQYTFQKVGAARKSLQEMHPIDKDDIVALNSWETIQLFRDHKLPHSLGLFDIGELLLNIVQLFVIFSVLFLVILQVYVCVALGQHQVLLEDAELRDWLWKSSIASIFAVAFSGSFVSFYSILNGNLVRYGGLQSVVHLELVAIVFVIIALVLLIVFGLRVRSDIVEFNDGSLRKLLLLVPAFTFASLVHLGNQKFFGLYASEPSRLSGYFLIIVLGIVSSLVVVAQIDKN